MYLFHKIKFWYNYFKKIVVNQYILILLIKKHNLILCLIQFSLKKYISNS